MLKRFCDICGCDMMSGGAGITGETGIIDAMLGGRDFCLTCMARLARVLREEIESIKSGKKIRCFDCNDGVIEYSHAYLSWICTSCGAMYEDVPSETKRCEIRKRDDD